MSDRDQPIAHRLINFLEVSNVMIGLIIAHDCALSVGYKNGLPWPHIQEDMKRYQQRTSMRVKLATKKTLSCLPEKLRDRKNYVEISRRGLELNEACLIYPDAMIVSGSDIYNYAMASQIPERVYTTHIHGTFIADTHISATPRAFGYEISGSEVIRSKAGMNITFSEWRRLK